MFSRSSRPRDRLLGQRYLGLLPGGFNRTQDPAMEPLLRDHERRSQRVTGVVRLFIGSVFAAISASATPGPPHFGLFVAASVAYMAIAALSLIAASGRHFRLLWAAVFIVLDVVWYEFVIHAGLLVYDLPVTAYVSLPLATLIFFFLALAGMRFTPLALLAGLAAFTMIEGTIFILILADKWPVPLLDPRPYFGPAATAVRFSVILAVGFVTAMTAWRSRRLLTQALSKAREQERARHLVGHLVPDALVDQLMETDGVLAPANREATIIYTDIEGFTGIVERLAPETVIAMLDAYFSAVEWAIVGSGGVVTQFQGDAALAVFNVPTAQPYHAAHAVDAARRIAEITELQTFAGERLPTRIGINTGQVVAGMVSGVERVGYTVHGDAVNLAARLEAMNKEFGTRLLVSATTVKALPTVEAAAFAPIGRIPIRGHSGPIEVFTLIGNEEEKN